MHTRSRTSTIDITQKHEAVKTPARTPPAAGDYALGCGPVSGCIVYARTRDKMALTYLLNPCHCA